MNPAEMILRRVVGRSAKSAPPPALTGMSVRGTASGTAAHPAPQIPRRERTGDPLISSRFQASRSASRGSSTGPGRVRLLTESTFETLEYRVGLIVPTVNVAIG